MGLFDGLSSMFGGALSGGESQVAGQLMGVLQQHGGVDGMSGLVSQFEQSGLSAHVASWVGNGQNLPISPDEVESALGSPAIASIASKFGIDPEQAKQMLAQHLPAAVSHMTPDGQVPDTTAAAPANQDDSSDTDDSNN